MPNRTVLDCWILIFLNSLLAGSLSSLQPSRPPCWAIPLAFGIIGYNRGDKGSGAIDKKEEFLCPVSWSVHHNLSHDGYIESIRCYVKARFLGIETSSQAL
jgi:hypothetical protein